jgi:hypothetical protein
MPHQCAQNRLGENKKCHSPHHFGSAFGQIISSSTIFPKPGKNKSEATRNKQVTLRQASVE